MDYRDYIVKGDDVVIRKLKRCFICSEYSFAFFVNYVIMGYCRFNINRHGVKLFLHTYKEDITHLPIMFEMTYDIKKLCLKTYLNNEFRKRI